MRTTTITVAVVLLLAVVYVLSYAPVYRWIGPWKPLESPIFYRPVEWLIEETPLQGPLTMWAWRWGVGEEIARDVIRRDRMRMTAED